jgi:hypothetical protein
VQNVVRKLIGRYFDAKVLATGNERTMSNHFWGFLERSWQWLRQYWYELVILIILFITTTISRLNATLRFPIEVGIDGAYYTINVISLLNGGYLYYDAPIFSFAVASLFAVVFHDVIIGVKFASAFFAGILTIGSYFAARSFTKGDWRAGLLAGVLVLVDVSQFQLVTSLVKNEAALAFIPFTLAFFYRFLNGDRQWLDFIGFVICGLLTTLSHLMTAALLFAALIVFAGYEFLGRLWNRKWREALFRILIPLGIGGVIFLGGYVVFDLMIPAADTWYTSSSLIKASSYTTSFDWGRGILELLEFFLGPQGVLSPNPLEWNLWIHFPVVVLIGVGVLTCLIRNEAGHRAALSLLFCTILLGMALASWSFRFVAMYFVGAYIVLSIGVTAIVDYTTLLVCRFWVNLRQFRFGQKAVALSLIAIVTGGVVWLATPRFLWTTTHIHPRAQPQDLLAIEGMQGQFPTNVIFYASHGIEYFITSRTWYEAAPESGYAVYPLVAAKAMYAHHIEESRPSYLVVDPSSHFYDNLNTIENTLVQVVSFSHSEIFDEALNVTVREKIPLNTVRIRLTALEDSANSISQSLSPLAGNYWSTIINTNGLPEGQYSILIIPFESPPPALPPIESILGHGRASIILYHFNNIPSTQMSLTEVLTLDRSIGVFNFYTVNQTTATSIDLLNRSIEEPTIQIVSPPPPFYMYILTPIFYLPYLGELSNFIILLLICPILGVYWLLLANLIVWCSKRLVIQFKTRRQAAKPSTTSASPVINSSMNNQHS